jgi:ArsR family metal-binding transcriptional regulator
MLLDRVENLEIFRPKMDSTKEVLHAIATFTVDISPVFPYVNAELGGWDYDQTNQVLLLKLSDGKWITLHPQKIAIRGARDIEEAKALLAWIQAQINDIYARREAVTPPLHQPGRAQGHGHLEAAAYDQLQGLRLRHLHGLCRGPEGRRDFIASL